MSSGDSCDFRTASVPERPTPNELRAGGRLRLDLPPFRAAGLGVRGTGAVIGFLQQPVRLGHRFPFLSDI
jgi:hypothetical protein